MIARFRAFWSWLTGRQARFDILLLEFRVNWLKQLWHDEKRWSRHLEDRLHREFYYGKFLEEEIEAVAPEQSIGLWARAKIDRARRRVEVGILSRGNGHVEVESEVPADQ